MGKFLQAALVILDTEKRPMRAREITILAKRRGLLDFSNGDTPWDTMKAKLSVDIKLYGLTSSFKRVEPGMYALREFERGEYYAPPRAFPKVVRPNDYVLVFRADSVAELGSFQGIRKAFHPYERTLLNPRYTTFIPRIQAETDPQYKQVVSYVIVKKADSVLRFVRGKYTSVEDFLKGSYCIGFGGHVQKTDADSWPLLAALDNDSGYMNSLYRELFEELKLPREITAKRVRTIGALNDDSSAVGRLHFAFVHLLDITEVPVGEARTLRREKSVNQLAFVPITKLAEEFEKYEYWSKLCIKTFFGDAVQLPCRIRKVRNFSLRHHSRYIVVCGGIGSGKTEACRVLEKRFGYHTISSGQVLQQLSSFASSAAWLPRRCSSTAGPSFLLADTPSSPAGSTRTGR
jgi:predicted NUDIX family phosphoesterase